MSSSYVFSFVTSLASNHPLGGSFIYHLYTTLLASRLPISLSPSVYQLCICFETNNILRREIKILRLFVVVHSFVSIDVLVAHLVNSLTKSMVKSASSWRRRKQTNVDYHFFCFFCDARYDANRCFLVLSIHFRAMMCASACTHFSLLILFRPSSSIRWRMWARRANEILDSLNTQESCVREISRRLEFPLLTQCVCVLWVFCWQKHCVVDYFLFQTSVAFDCCFLPIFRHFDFTMATATDESFLSENGFTDTVGPVLASSSSSSSSSGAPSLKGRKHNAHDTLDYNVDFPRLASTGPFDHHAGSSFFSSAPFSTSLNGNSTSSYNLKKTDDDRRRKMAIHEKLATTKIVRFWPYVFFAPDWFICLSIL